MMPIFAKNPPTSTVTGWRPGVMARCIDRFRGAARPAARGPRLGLEALEPRQLLAIDPSPLQQAMLEDINRMRIDPQAELDVLFSQTQPLAARDADIQSAVEFFDVDSAALLDQWQQLDPVAPLAWSEQLNAAAEAHSQQMIEQDEQSHVLNDEPELGERVRDAGYQWSIVSENVFAFAKSTLHAHAGFVIDWGNGPTGIQDPPGHRTNIMHPDLREVGLAVLSENDSRTDVGPLVVTQDFGGRRDYVPQLLGVVFDDNNANRRYDAGEELGGIELVVDGTGGQFRTRSMSAGGYQLPVPNGTYTVTAMGGGLRQPVSVSGVVVRGVNVKVDFDLDNRVSRPGDSNHDGQFNQLDLVLVLQANQYLTGRAATFEQGDWNGDTRFDARDIVFALQSGGFRPGSGLLV